MDDLLLVLLRFHPVRIQLIVVSAIYPVEFCAGSRDVLAVLVVREACRPATRGRVRSVHAHLRFVGADAGASAGVDGSVDLREPVIKQLAIIIQFLFLQLVARLYDQRLLIGGSGIDLAVEGLELSVHGALLPKIRLTGEAAVLAGMLQHIAVIELVRALADIYFSINSGCLCPHAVLNGCFLLAKLAQCDRLRINHVIGIARLLLVHDVAAFLAANWLSIVSVPTLLDLVGLLRHLPRDHVHFLV